MVKEIILEVFMELHLDQIVSEAISKSVGKINFIKEEKLQMKDPKIEQHLLEKRRKMLDEMHARSESKQQQPKNVLTEILDDTKSSGFTIQDIGDANENPELVSANELDGLLNEMPNMSKFV